MIRSLSQRGQHRLDEPAFLNPFVFNQIRFGKAQPVVVDAHTIEVDGERFTLENPEEVMLTPGQTVYITLAGSFYLNRP